MRGLLSRRAPCSSCRMAEQGPGQPAAALVLGCQVRGTHRSRHPESRKPGHRRETPPPGCTWQRVADSTQLLDVRRRERRRDATTKCGANATLVRNQCTYVKQPSNTLFPQELKQLALPILVLLSDGIHVAGLGWLVARVEGAQTRLHAVGSCKRCHVDGSSRWGDNQRLCTHTALRPTGRLPVAQNSQANPHPKKGWNCCDGRLLHS